jgi:hypothetical protein
MEPVIIGSRILTRVVQKLWGLEVAALQLKQHPGREYHRFNYRPPEPAAIAF